MRSKTITLVAVLAVLAAVGATAALYRPPARSTAAAVGDEPPPAKEKSKPEADEAAVRATADAFVKAFGKGDAKALAALWTASGEYVGPDGESLRGRKDIEKSYAEFFEKHPKAALVVRVESVKMLGRHTALEEGTLEVKLPREKAPGVSRYSVLHVRQEDGWKMASVREWVPDPAQLVTLKDVEWLVGEWSASSKELRAKVTYAWDEDKASLQGRYVIRRDGKVVASGTQVIRKDPNGGLRSWQFDSSGAHGEWAWAREGNNWVIEAGGTLPDGTEVTALNLLVPVGRDGFTWQSIERTVGGAELPSVPPVKVTRVKAKK
jgi:uncharacterized protein (TIGR02246 family)